MKQILLLTFILLSGCTDFDVQMDADIPSATSNETMYACMDHFNNENIKTINK